MADRHWPLTRKPRLLLAATLALALVAGLVVVGVLTWQRLHRSNLEQAVRLVPASSLRVGFTDWEAVRRALKADLGDTPDKEAVEEFIAKAYEADFSAASSVDASAAALQSKYGFSPATAQWEAFAQGRRGATMVLKVADGADFDVLAGNLRSAGYQKPKQDDGVWDGGADLVSTLDPTLTPELQYVVLLADQGLVVTSDNKDYAATAARVAAGDAGSFASVEGITDITEKLGDPANAMLWGGDFACTDLAMSSAAPDDQLQADRLIESAGGVTPLAGLGTGMAPNRTLRVVVHFEDSDRARKNLEPRAKLVVGEAVGRGGSLSDDLELVTSKATGSEVLFDLVPRTKTGFVLSSVYDGPVLFATC